MRVENWEHKLNEYIEANKDKAFKYGTWDCCIFTAGAVHAITGINHIKGFKYKSKKVAEKILEANGGIVTILDEKFKQIPSSLAKRGDLVLYNQAVGICIGARGLFLNPEGYSTVSMNDIVLAWGVE